ncbi:MAG: extracellular solute-binding protein [Clostridiales bacterium]|nr:extracellular solute-binding protein [Clostridiales bacterium]
MKHFIRKILSISLVLSVVLATSCHGSRKTAAFDIPDSFDDSRNIEITFWAKNDTNITQTRIYEKAISDFEELYPNINVNLRLYTDYGKIYNDVITNIATDTTPNVCITYPDHIATYMTGNNVVVPLDTLFEDPEYGLGGTELRYDSPSIDQVIPEYLDECMIDGVHYAIPFMRSTEACYVNKTYVEALGYELPEVLTWDFVWEVSEAAMARNPDGTFAINGQMTMIPFIYKSTDNMMIQMLRQKGAGYSTEEGSVEIFNDTTAELLKTVASHAETGAFSTFKISSYPANFLNAGQCIFAVDSTAGATWMGTDAPLTDISADKLVQFETEVMTVPQFDPENPQMISQGPSICIFNKEDPQVVLASWLFAQYLITNEVQIAYAETEGYVPVTSMAREDEDYIDYLNREGEDNSLYYSIKIQASKILIENTSNTFVTPVFNGSTSLRDAAGYMIENVTKSVRRHITVDDAYIEQLYSDTSSLYRLDRMVGGDLGPLPGASKALLTTLAVVWAGIGAYFVYDRMKKKKQ